MTAGTSRHKTFIFFASLLLFAGCNNDVIYTDSIPIPEENWSLSNVPSFTVPVADTATICDISLSIRTGTSYPYRNIWLFINTLSPSGKSLTDTIQYFLADEKGKWYGKGFGDIHELSLPVRKGVYFAEKGNYVFTVRHGMRNENLKGVYDLGLKVTKFKNQD